MTANDQSNQNLTLVFKVANLSLEQEKFYLGMMDRLKILWNIGVEAFENYDRYTTNNQFIQTENGKEKKINLRFSSCPIPVLPEKITSDNSSRWEYQKFYYVDRETGAIEHNVAKKLE